MSFDTVSFSLINLQKNVGRRDLSLFRIDVCKLVSGVVRGFVRVSKITLKVFLWTLKTCKTAHHQPAKPNIILAVATDKVKYLFRREISFFLSKLLRQATNNTRPSVVSRINWYERQFMSRLFIFLFLKTNLTREEIKRTKKYQNNLTRYL